MENGDLRAVVRYLLPAYYPNCTYHMRLYADRRDPPLPPALHVSNQHRLGDNPGYGARNEDRWPRRACTCSAVFLGALPPMLKTETRFRLCVMNFTLMKPILLQLMRAVAFNIHSLVQFVLVNTGTGFRGHTEVPLANQAFLGHPCGHK